MNSIPAYTLAKQALKLAQSSNAGGGGGESVDAASVSTAIADMDATQAATAQPGILPPRNAATVYPDGFLTQDASGIWRGDGATAGGILQASPSFSVAATGAFLRTGAALEPEFGGVAATGEPNTLSIPVPTWSQERSAPIALPDPPTNYKLIGVGDGGQLMAGALSSATPAVLKRSTDGGQTWATVTLGASAGYAIRIDRFVGATKTWLIASGLYNSLLAQWISYDDGATWTAVTTTAGTGLASPTFHYIYIAQAPGTTVGASKLLAAPYGTHVNATSPTDRANRVWRSTRTVAEIEAGGALAWELVFKFSMSQYYGTTPGFNRDATKTVITDGVVGSAAASSLTEMGKFAGLTLANHYVEILTDPNGTPAGAAVGQERVISSHNDDTLTLSAAWGVQPSAGATYRVTQLQAGGAGMHIHTACYVPATSDGTTDNLFVCVGDGVSGGIIRVTGLSTAPAAPDVAGQSVNWSLASYCHFAQPTRLVWYDNTLVIIGSDGQSSSRLLDVSPYTRTVIACDHRTAAGEGTDFTTSWDGEIGSDGAIVAINNSPTTAHANGIHVGNKTGPWKRIYADTSQAIDTFISGLSDITLCGQVGTYRTATPGIIVQRPTIAFRDFTFLGPAVTNLVTNPELNDGGTGTPTGWTYSGSDVKSVVNAPLGYGGAKALKVENDGSAGSYIWQAVTGFTEGDVAFATAAFYHEGMTGTASPVSIVPYNGTSALTGTGVVQTGPSQAVYHGKWNIHWYAATCPATTDRVRINLQSGSSTVGAIWLAAPLLLKNQLWVPPLSRGAETLRYTIGAVSGALKKTKLTLYWAPWVGSTIARNVTEPILSVQSVDGRRILLNWVDDGAGTQNWVVTTATSAGTTITTHTMGSLRHTERDLLQFVITHDKGRLSFQLGWPGGLSLRSSGQWTRAWNPALVALGENYWTPGSRHTGWYLFDGVTQQ